MWCSHRFVEYLGELENPYSPTDPRYYHWIREHGRQEAESETTENYPPTRLEKTRSERKFEREERKERPPTDPRYYEKVVERALYKVAKKKAEQRRQKEEAEEAAERRLGPEWTLEY